MTSRYIWSNSFMRTPCGRRRGRRRQGGRLRAFGEDGQTIDEVKFSGRGCAISQAATSMLTEMVKGRTATEVAVLDKDELLEEIGIPLTPVRLKCAMLGLTTLKVALHKAKGTPLPEGLAGFDDLELS